MISSSCGIRVLPKNCTSSAPLDCAVASLAIQSNATAADSGIALMWANTSFFGALCAKAGARPVARMPAMPAPARSSVRRFNETRLVGADMGFLRSLVFYDGIVAVRRKAYSIAWTLPAACSRAAGLQARPVGGLRRLGREQSDAAPYFCRHRSGK